MTADDFRELALNLPGATESAHMKHPDFRAHGRIFATLGYPDASRGMVKLPPAEQKRFVDLHPQAFSPVNGAWGLGGCTSVNLSAAKRDIVSDALSLAWEFSATIAPARASKSAARKPSDSKSIASKPKSKPKAKA